VAAAVTELAFAVAAVASASLGTESSW
jgi:hypothetical protein